MFIVMNCSDSFSFLIYIISTFSNNFFAGLGGSVGCVSDWWSGGRGFEPCPIQQHSFVEIDHEIFSMVIFSLLLIQKGQLSISGKRMCTSTGLPLRGLHLPRKKCG